MNEEGEVDMFHVFQLEHLPVKLEGIQQETRLFLSKVNENATHGWKINSESKEMEPYCTRRSGLIIHQYYLLWEIRVVVPPSL